ncbi:MAG: DEAD/DEAH box helicase [Dehalococcoidia bacterium]
MTQRAEHVHHEAAPHPAAHDPLPKRNRRSRGRRGRGTGEHASTAPTGAGKLPAAKAPISETFAALGVGQTALEAIAALGYTDPTPIQKAALPRLLEGEDLIGLAQTGTGKTIAFGIPLARSIDPARNEVQAVVMVPTRELANQVKDVITHLGLFYGFSTIGLVGGSRVRSDILALERGGHVIVGTPGRVIDHLKRGTLRLEGVHFVVLDEADAMLDIGFARDIDYILRTVPKQRQTALFSATMPTSIARLTYRHMRKAETIEIEPEQRTAAGVRQLYCEVSEREKFLALRFIFETQGLGRTLVFRNTKIGVDRLTDQLVAAGVHARAIHGDLRQGQRDRVMQDFRSGELEFLVATNVAARGLDIPDIENVINYDVPQNAEEYIHRIGRTARAGKEGASYTFVGEWDLDFWDVIRQEVGDENLEYLKLPSRWD